MIVVFVDIRNITESGWRAQDGGRAQWWQLRRQWGKNFGVKGKGHEIQRIPMLL